MSFHVRRLFSHFFFNNLLRPSASLYQDIMILDPSMFFGVADMHDRHRDMRLDVDNMSYEVILVAAI